MRRTWVGALLAAVVSGCATAPAPPPATRPDPAPTSASVPAPATPSTSTSPASTSPASTPGPDVADAEGAQPQTSASPVPSGPVFEAGTAALWRAVLSGNAAAGAPAFFPLPAYVQVKTVADPTADWQHRLFDDFALDVRAAHDQVASQGADPTLIGVDVPSGQASWIRPGACANRVGYWHVAGPRVVYRAGGRVRSFGIASMISWRGAWYVVHLGAVVRHGSGGIVDRPAAGPGAPGPPGGC